MEFFNIIKNINKIIFIFGIIRKIIKRNLYFYYIIFNIFIVNSIYLLYKICNNVTLFNFE